MDPTAIQRLAPSCRLPWHSHDEGYAAIVLEGGYMEAGDGGRVRVTAGHVLVHSPFSGHADWIDGRGAGIVNVPLPLAAALACRSGRTADPEGLVRSLREAPEAASAILSEAVVEATPAEADLPDRLALAMRQEERLSLAHWAAAHRISTRTLTRQFRQCFGLAPARFRWRARTLAAWRAILLESQPLASVAASFGFSDQAHLTRSVRALTGRPPKAWRRGTRATLSD
ncbi:helix-turn-helix domain-containing protein [Sphingosinicella terrae]|uniref:helix-turn-helix domain-containing protein n=1 Tax=Sphingosinicella terrae TaxID=2172047 RepID=UPI0013B4215A|nr:helix-turn-helix domain-containing protein [Sphingosinicella terrae]